MIYGRMLTYLSHVFSVLSILMYNRRNVSRTSSILLNKNNTNLAFESFDSPS